MISNQMIDTLKELGGDDFVIELAHCFCDDGIKSLRRMGNAVRECDEEEFRNGAHALRSASVNIGAQSVFDLCHLRREITAAELHEEGISHLVEFAQDLEQAIIDLEHILSVSLKKPDLDKLRRIAYCA